MSEKESLRHTVQPPERLFEAQLVSNFDERIQINNQNTQVVRFNDNPATAFIETISKTERCRIFTQDQEVLGVLSEIGCRTLDLRGDEDQYTRLRVGRISVGGAWDVFDVTGAYSIKVK